MRPHRIHLFRYKGIIYTSLEHDIKRSNQAFRHSHPGHAGSQSTIPVPAFTCLAQTADHACLPCARSPARQCRPQVDHFCMETSMNMYLFVFEIVLTLLSLCISFWFWIMHCCIPAITTDTNTSRGMIWVTLMGRSAANYGDFTLSGEWSPFILAFSKGPALRTLMIWAPLFIYATKVRTVWALSQMDRELRIVFVSYQWGTGLDQPHRPRPPVGFIRPSPEGQRAWLRLKCKIKFVFCHNLVTGIIRHCCSLIRIFTRDDIDVVLLWCVYLFSLWTGYDVYIRVPCISLSNGIIWRGRGRTRRAIENVVFERVGFW